MEMRRLGTSGLSISAIGFGVMTFGGSGFFEAMGNTGDEGARRQVDMCLDAGVNLFDTADVYSQGASEEILGRALGPRRKEAVIATKAFGRMGPGAHDLGLSRQHLVAACEDSLRRLGTDWIDLYQVHSFDALVPLEETQRALDDLVRAGKVRYIGCSNYSGWQLMKALGLSRQHGWERFVAQQIQYSLIVRDAEQELLPCGVDQGVGALIWSPLAQGYLTGKFRGGDAGESRLKARDALKGLDTPRGREIVDAVCAIADERGVPPSQVAINWLLRRPGVSSVLIGARTEAQLAETLAAADWTLADAEVERLDRVSQPRSAYPNSHHRLYASERNPQLFPHYRRG